MHRGTVDPRAIEQLLSQVKRGTVRPAEAAKRIAGAWEESLPFATIDHHRAHRQGFPEVIFSEGKTPAQVAAIAQRVLRHGHVMLATRAGLPHFRAVKRKIAGARYNAVARTIVAHRGPIPLRGRGTILVVTAGTSDIPVAEEAVETSRVMGNNVRTLYDVGVAGLHRILSRSDLLRESSVVVVVAGMEGALASVVGGLVRCPVIAVPTSVGYGASFHGVAALLGMLTSCAAGVTVVNIDNGFGAGFAAGLINRTADTP
jgi:NCAIR mutase (PurE)-related protein